MAKYKQCGGAGGFCKGAQCRDGVWPGATCPSGFKCYRVSQYHWCVLGRVASALLSFMHTHLLVTSVDRQSLRCATVKAAHPRCALVITIAWLHLLVGSGSERATEAEQEHCCA